MGAKENGVPDKNIGSFKSPIFSGSASLHPPASFQILQQTGKSECIKDAFGRYATFARHFHAPVRQIEFVSRMCVWIDAHDTAELQGPTMPAPIEIQPPGVSVDLNGNPVLGTSGEDRLDVYFIPRPAQELPSSHVAENSGVRILHRSNDALRLGLAVQLEAAVNRALDRAGAPQS